MAEILSTADRAIEQTEAIIAKQQRIKTALMQDILTGRVRVTPRLEDGTP
ncbi:MAG: restriction endonuclease subunit S [Methanosarcinales archaeon]|nr:MAG: restriction endonuclease subunit S [Methanosarcinales archaeon]